MTKFSDLKLSPKVLKAIEEAGYESPTPIQAGAIPPALEGRDVLGIAQTGTGKTASFTLPMITMLARGRARARMPRSLVLCPTRELAAQVAENFDTYAKNVKLTKALLIGGVSFKEQDMAIDKGVDVLIATPGRLLDHFERGKLILNDVKIMVVDEADRMLDMGFIPDIERIFGLTPFTRQTLFFSATMAPEIERITNTFLSNPERIEVARQATTNKNITQGVLEFKASRKDREGSEKRKVLRALIDAEGDKCTNAIIFCNRKMDVDVVAKSLKKYGYDAAPIHGDLDQSQRTKTLDGFREGALRFLVASDVAARGLDVPSVSHVYNFDVPSHAEDYVHRIGRTGRAGRDGTAIMICVPRDEKNLADVERLVQHEIPRLENPLGGAKAPAKEAEATTEDAPKSDKPKRTRSRSRKSDAPKAENAPQQDATAPQADKAETQAQPAPAEAKQEPKAAEQRNNNSRGGSQDGRKDNKRNDNRDSNSRSRNDNRGGRNNNNNNDRGGNRVVGLGDHTPEFIELSFADRPDS
ncbi:DEAD/DEAH box helicase [Sulfitobacter geojensis]|uniref:DEAD-box ATP-dependent RNA helicase RhpA n=1 Tax=Sulfitobacter geojensis TaxID=1342299 RepID=A0AAE2VVJ3_9RHOB|nr:DEAD/DEAH box helicase [Sulfitobacter geojensis]MBM1687942.1 DEAD/DEAH box helicase [Sulfitobacter geojensis]MBM1692009.1 DEAD/DEAH box helicase [Sulfitobacter geojensis]MBM1704175.1 DEAD/DEAH box helicase [Sulfitobacter geojensis]MBM1708233.1 DEAD/DEAH box helicase [Sulfitobacter geojensis]MBM1712298.1 DEAD/DEAH box helicase [Sulfitobacter geojensis]